MPATGRSRPASRRSRARRSATTTCSMRPRPRRLARLLRGPGRRHRQAHEPVRRRRAPDAARGLGRRPRGRPGVRVRGRGGGHRDGGPRARRAPDVDLPRGRRRARVRRRRARGPGGQAEPARRAWTARSADRRRRRAACSIRWGRSGRRVARCSSPPRTPGTTTPPAGRWSRSGRPRTAERADLDLAWRLCRGVVSNAIVLVRDGMLVGLGSGQVSRVDACRGAVEKARQFQGEAGATRRRRRLGRVLPVRGRPAGCCSTPA